MADSIEWMTADSDRVVVGKVAKVETRPEATTGNPIWFYATIAVSQTLKGPVDKTVDIVVRNPFGDSPAKWKQDNREVLLFLVKSRTRAARDGDHKSQYDDAPFALRYGRHGSDAYLLDGSAKAYTVMFDSISKKTDLIAAVKRAASSTATKALQLDVPLDSRAGRSLWGGSAVFLYVPIDAALETLAIGWIGDGEGAVRDRGVRALAHFKSAANISRLEGMLHDTATHDVTEGNKPTVRRFYVRKRAHETLVAWGVPHTTPPIEMPVPKPP